MPLAFVFDPNRCTGCQACELACSIENELGPDRSWRGVVTFNEEAFPGIPLFHLSLACNHCAEPACMNTCPALAYHRDEETGAVLVDVDTDETLEIDVPDPLILEKISVSRSFYEADVRINAPVMKTHDQLIMTLGMKNMKGVIQKPTKRLFHRIGLAKAVVDLNKAVPLNLTVVDAIHAMEGLGPSLGNVFEMDTIIASTDVYSLDIVGARIMGIDPGELEYMKYAAEQGLVRLDGGGIQVVGEPVESVARAFERPPMDLSPQEGITVIEKGACSACRGTIRSVYIDLENMGVMDRVRDLVMLVGPQAEIPENLEQTPLIMGICLHHLKDEGRYVVGCPPNNDKMREAIMELTGIEA